jgi:hypothetical protein
LANLGIWAGVYALRLVTSLLRYLLSRVQARSEDGQFKLLEINLGLVAIGIAMIPG